MSKTNILPSGASFSDFADITVADGTRVGLVGRGVINRLWEVVVALQLADGSFIDVGRLNAGAPSMVLTIPGLYRTSRTSGSSAVDAIDVPYGASGGGGTSTGGTTNGLTDAQLRAANVAVSVAWAVPVALDAPTLAALETISVANFPATQAVSGPATNTELRATPLAVSGPATDAQMRASALAVSGPVTDAQLRATAVPVAGPVTDAQLRAAAVPVSVASQPLPTGASTEATVAAMSAKLPSAVGVKTAALSLGVVIASDQALVPVNPLGQPGVARKIAAAVAGGASNSQALTTTVRRVSAVAIGSALRYVVGTGAQTASATSNLILQNERLDLNVPANGVIAVLSDSATAGTLEVTELS